MSELESTEALCKHCMKPFRTGQLAYQKIKIKSKHEIGWVIEYGRLVIYHEKCVTKRTMQ